MREERTEAQPGILLRPSGARRRPEWGTLLLSVLWIVWLAALGAPLGSLLAAPVAPVYLAAVLAGTAGFVALYLWTAWHNALRLPAPAARPWPIALLAALSLALTLGDGPGWLVLFIFSSACAAGYLPTRAALIAIAALAGIAAVAGVLVAAPQALLAEILIRVATVGIAIASLTRAVLMERALQAARADIARLAVAEERLRFARDLHDLLGRSLSLIALKTELAERLVAKAPERATSEIRDAKTVARTALREVREAVAGYRQPTLTSELQGAEELLTTAGIAYHYAGAPGPLPAPVEAALAWTVREGVTNILRHARACQCVISLRRAANEVALEVTNDGSAGRGPAPGPAEGTPGNGLTGLRERVTALGGQCETGPLPGGGFRLTVTLPLGRRPGTPDSGPGAAAAQSAQEVQA
jgi:two-component system, NarL family, sensor histidine kinase DesK